MLESFSTNATVSKARAFYGKRLKQSDYDELLQKTTVAEVAEYLKTHTHYGDELQNIDTNTIHRGFLEALLKRYSFNQYARLCKFQGLDKIAFFNYLSKTMEIQMLVSCLLLINAGTTEDFIAKVPSYFIAHCSYNLLELSKAKSFNDILNVVKKTPYFDILKDEVPDANGLYDCAKIEHNLRCYYLAWVQESLEKGFSPKVKKELLSIINTQFDLINIINAFRIKAFYNSSADDIEKFMLPTRGKMASSSYRYLYESKDSTEYIDRLKNTFYGKQIVEFDSDMTAPKMETDIRFIRAKYAKLHLRATNSAPVSVYSILFLLDIEIENITNIIEGIRYKAPVSYIQSLLII